MGFRTSMMDLGLRTLNNALEAKLQKHAPQENSASAQAPVPQPELRTLARHFPKNQGEANRLRALLGAGLQTPITGTRKRDFAGRMLQELGGDYIAKHPLRHHNGLIPPQPDAGLVASPSTRLTETPLTEGPVSGAPVPPMPVVDTFPPGPLFNTQLEQTQDPESPVSQASSTATPTRQRPTLDTSFSYRPVIAPEVTASPDLPAPVNETAFARRPVLDSLSTQEPVPQRPEIESPTSPVIGLPAAEIRTPQDLAALPTGNVLSPSLNHPAKEETVEPLPAPTPARSTKPPAVLSSPVEAELLEAEMPLRDPTAHLAGAGKLDYPALREKLKEMHENGEDELQYEFLGQHLAQGGVESYTGQQLGYISRRISRLAAEMEKPTLSNLGEEMRSAFLGYTKPEEANSLINKIVEEEHKSPSMSEADLEIANHLINLFNQRFPGLDD